MLSTQVPAGLQFMMLNSLPCLAKLSVVSTPTLRWQEGSVQLDGAVVFLSWGLWSFALHRPKISGRLASLERGWIAVWFNTFLLSSGTQIHEGLSVGLIAGRQLGKARAFPYRSSLCASTACLPGLTSPEPRLSLLAPLSSMAQTYCL